MSHSQPAEQTFAPPSPESSKESMKQMTIAPRQPMGATSTKSSPTNQSENQLDGITRVPDSSPLEEPAQDRDQPHEPERTPRHIKALQGLKWFIRDQWFLLAMGAVVLIASQAQVPASQQRIKRTVVTYLSVSVIFLVNGCTIKTDILIANYKRWKLHIFVQLQCYLVCSAATFAIVSLCATNPNFMDPWLLIGFLFIGSAPTTMASNVVMTRQAHGNTALTAVQSVIGQFLCPFLTPIILQMYLSAGAWYSKVLTNTGNYGEIYRRVFMQLGLSLFVPLCAGQIVQWLFPKQTKKIFFDWKFIKLSSIALLTLVWQTFDQAFESGAFEQIKTSNIVFIIFIAIALYMVWLAICFTASSFWLPKKDVIACCYCCPAKALAVIVPLSSVMYLDISPIQQSKMQIPAIIFQAIQIVIGAIFTIIFRRWIRPDEQREEAQRNVEAGQEK